MVIGVFLQVFRALAAALRYSSRHREPKNLTASCAQGGGGSVTIEGPDPDDGDPPAIPHADRTTKYDWCDKYLISDSVVGV